MHYPSFTAYPLRVRVTILATHWSTLRSRPTPSAISPSITWKGTVTEQLTLWQWKLNFRANPKFGKELPLLVFRIFLQMICCNLWLHASVVFLFVVECYLFQVFHQKKKKKKNTYSQLNLSLLIFMLSVPKYTELCWKTDQNEPNYRTCFPRIQQLTNIIWLNASSLTFHLHTWLAQLFAPIHFITLKNNKRASLIFNLRLNSNCRESLWENGMWGMEGKTDQCSLVWRYVMYKCVRFS